MGAHMSKPKEDPCKDHKLQLLFVNLGIFNNERLIKESQERQKDNNDELNELRERQKNFEENIKDDL